MVNCKIRLQCLQTENSLFWYNLLKQGIFMFENPAAVKIT